MSGTPAYGGNFADSRGNVCQRVVENGWEKPVHRCARNTSKSDWGPSDEIIQGKAATGANPSGTANRRDRPDASFFARTTRRGCALAGGIGNSGDCFRVSTSKTEDAANRIDKMRACVHHAQQGNL
jgi:hypothetical protein